MRPAPGGRPPTATTAVTRPSSVHAPTAITAATQRRAEHTTQRSQATNPACGPAGRRPTPPVTATIAASTIRGVRSACARHSSACRDADQRGDRRRQRHGVVGMDGAVHEAEHRAGHQQPAAPQQQRRRDPSVRAARRVNQRPASQTDQRGGQQPRRLDTHGRPEQPADARLSAEEQVARRAHRDRRTAAPGPPATVPRRRRCARSRCSRTPIAAGCCRWSPPM